jgi:hypothetical protein
MFIIVRLLCFLIPFLFDKSSDMLTYIGVTSSSVKIDACDCVCSLTRPFSSCVPTLIISSSVISVPPSVCVSVVLSYDTLLRSSGTSTCGIVSILDLIWSAIVERMFCFFNSLLRSDFACGDDALYS